MVPDSPAGPLAAAQVMAGTYSGWYSWPSLLVLGVWQHGRAWERASACCCISEENMYACSIGPVEVCKRKLADGSKTPMHCGSPQA